MKWVNDQIQEDPFECVTGYFPVTNTIQVIYSKDFIYICKPKIAYLSQVMSHESINNSILFKSNY